MSNPWTSYISTLRATTARELDLRYELHEILFGNPTKNMLPHGRIFIIRRFRRDTDNERVPCTCLNPNFNRPARNPSHKCRFCDAEGYLFEDHFVVGYFSMEYPQPFSTKEESFGSLEAIAPSVYFEYNVQVDEKDYILEPYLTEEGELADGPVKIKRRLKINVCQEMRADRGRIEYLRCRVSEDHT